jgi:hypothetical protein
VDAGSSQVVTSGKTWDPLPLQAPVSGLVGIGEELARKLPNLRAVLEADPILPGGRQGEGVVQAALLCVVERAVVRSIRRGIVAPVM